jgi:hypothetical protein
VKNIRGIAVIAVIAVILAFAPVVSAAPPMRIALLVDTSAATASAIVQIRAAVVAFLDALPPEHEVLLVTTGRRTQVRVPPTTDRTKLKGNVSGMLPELGPTALLDSLAAVDARFMRKAGDRSPVFVVLTADGSENSHDLDQKGFNQWVDDIVRRRVSVNAILLKTSANGVPESIASGLAQATNGHYVSMGIAGNIAEAMAQLAAKLGDDAARRP